MSWRWLCVQHVQNPLQESLNQASASLDLEEAVCTNSGPREARKSGLNKAVFISDVFTPLELSRIGWDVLCRQSCYSDQGGYQEIG